MSTARNNKYVLWDLCGVSVMKWSGVCVGVKDYNIYI